MFPRHLIVAAAFAALFLLVATWVAWPAGLEWQRAAVAGLGFALLIYVTGAALSHRAHRRYDLGALRDLEEQGGPAPEDNFGPMDDTPTILCPYCGTVYDHLLRVCPNCRR